MVAAPKSRSGAGSLSGAQDLGGKVIVVTGGASGIGAGMCRVLAAAGAAIGVADVNRAAGRRLVSELRRHGHEACFVETNVADSLSVAAAVQAVCDQYGSLDAMINNAGIGSQTSGDEAGWWRLLRINVLGVAWGMREAIASMRGTGGGSIVNTGSHAGLRSARAGVYGSSKAAVHALTRYGALAHARDKIRVNAVLPGNIYTPIHDRRRHDALVALMDGDDLAFETDPLDRGHAPDLDREAMLDEFRRIHPMGELAQVTDIADAARYLVSDAASVVTGNELLVTGGIMAAQLADRLNRSVQAIRTPAVPAPAGTIALISRDTPIVDALGSEFARVGRPVAALTSALAADPTGAVRWLRQVDNLAGVVFAMRPDPSGDLFSQGPQVWDEEVSADFRVPWVIADAARHLLPPGGVVTFIADSAGLTGALASPAFCATAAALIYATDDLADSLRRHGIRLNTIVAETIGRTRPDSESTLGGPASRTDVAAIALTLTRTASLSGLQLSLQTSQPD